MTPRAIGLRIGRASARDALAGASCWARWPGLAGVDTDQALGAGLTPGTAAWTDMESAAREEYEFRMRAAQCDARGRR